MKTAEQILNELRIVYRKSYESKQTCTCPQCSHTRKKKNSKCLSVTIDHEGVRWFCHHCGWCGGEYYDSKRPDDRFTKPKRKVLSLEDINHRRRRMG